MIKLGQMNDGRLAHNGSFFTIVNESLGAIKLGWGDFATEDVPDMRIQVESHLLHLLQTWGWVVQDVELPAHDGMKCRTVTRIATIPAGTEVFVLGERDSYWDAQENGAVLHASTGPSRDPSSVSMFRDMLPREALVLDARYVRAYARGIWKDGTYTRIAETREQAKLQSAWRQLWQEKEEAGAAALNAEGDVS